MTHITQFCSLMSRSLDRWAVLGVFVTGLAGLTAVMGGTPAHAEWKICNYSTFVVEAAVGYRDSGDVWTEGWVRVRPGDCSTALARPLIPGEHYLYARSSAAHQGGRREWASNQELCVDEVEDNFLFSNGVRCESVGASTRLFATIQIDQAKWQTSLTEPRASNRRIRQNNAQAGGIQRLLSDAGFYDARRIDGIPGRRTENAVSAFLRSISRSRRPGDAELIDLLERQAMATRDRRGLTVCNQLSEDSEADIPVWTAIALRRNGTWESRGWWRLDPTECALLVSDDLSGKEYYLYADTSDAGSTLALANGIEAFCLARGRFAIAGRTRCDERGYDSGEFMRIRSDDDAVRISLAADDFADTPAGQDG